MKRSEAIKLIAKVVKTIRSGDKKASATNSAILHEEEYANFILHRLESVGMLPPEATVEKIINCGDGQKIETSTEHAWEDEE